MHTRVGDQSPRLLRNNSKPPPFPPTESIRDSTDELYLAVIHDSSDSSSASSASSGGSIPRMKDIVKKKRRSINDISEGARQRRSYFSSATRRELIQFGPEVGAITID
jgi:hypothetical protein